MSKSRQSANDPSLVRTFGLTFHSPRRFTYPAPGWDQLVHATRGSLTVHTSEGSWVVAANRALWVPSGKDAEFEVRGAAAMRSLYFRIRAVQTLPRNCCMVNISPLLRELIVCAVSQGALDRRIAEHRRLAGVVMDQMRVLPSAPLQLPMPQDARARLAAERLLRDPATPCIESLARHCGASSRTLERLFRDETGLSAGVWIRRARLLGALQRLAEGNSVTAVAAECGYATTSAFVSMFRREIGSTPGRYFHPGSPTASESVAFKRKNG
ncbi:MAG: helix-turn-helix transcriptional regulator [Bryobacteraceae bacterium]